MNDNDFAKICQEDWKTPAHRCNEGRLLLAQIRDVLVSLEQLEVQYGVNIQKVADRLHMINKFEGSGVTEAINAFRQDLQLRGTAALQFAKSLRDDVIEANLQQAVSNHERVYIAIEADATEADRFLADVEADHAEATVKHVQKTKVCLEHTIAAQQSFNEPSKVKVECFSKALQSIRAQEQTVAHKIERRQMLIAARQDHQHKMCGVLKALEDMDRKRMLCLRDSLLKAFVHRASQSRHLEYNMKKAILVVEELDCDQELREFLSSCFMYPTGSDKKNSPSTDLINGCASASNEAADEGELSWQEEDKQLPTKIAYLARRRASAVERHSFPSAETAGIVIDFIKKNPTIDGLIRQAKASIVSPTTEDKKVNPANESDETLNKIIPMADLLLRCTQIYSSIDPAKQSTFADQYSSLLDALLTNDRDKFNSAFPDDNAMQTMLDSFSAGCNRVSFGMLFVRKVFRNPIVFVPTEECFYNLAFVVKVLLDWIDVHRDHWTARLILNAVHLVATKVAPDYKPSLHAIKLVDTQNLSSIMSFGTSTELEAEAENSTEQRLLYQELYLHPIWNKIEFWSNSLVVSISEDHQRSFLLRAWREAGISCSNDEEINILERSFAIHNPCHTALSNFSRYMVNLGINASQVSELFQRVAARYMLQEDYVNQLTHGLLVAE